MLQRLTMEILIWGERKNSNNKNVTSNTLNMFRTRKLVDWSLLLLLCSFSVFTFVSCIGYAIRFGRNCMGCMQTQNMPQATLSALDFIQFNKDKEIFTSLFPLPSHCLIYCLPPTITRIQWLLNHAVAQHVAYVFVCRF